MQQYLPIKSKKKGHSKTDDKQSAATIIVQSIPHFHRSIVDFNCNDNHKKKGYSISSIGFYQWIVNNES
jgi:hypothetical protein